MLEAHLTHDTDFIVKMDPYVKFELEGQDWRSNVI